MTLLRRALIGLAAGRLLASPAFAQPAPASPGGQHDSRQQDSKRIPLPTYEPPTRGSPNARTSGSTRGVRPMPPTHSATGSSGPQLP